MLFTIADRPSDSPFVERIWRSHSERAGVFTSVAVSHWEMVVTRYHGKAYMTVRGPETKATPLHNSMAGAEYFGIIFKLGTVLPYLPASTLVDGHVNLPEATSEVFWLNGSAWQFPNYENADAFVDRLVRTGLLVRDPIVEAVLQNQPQELSIRSVQRRFQQATGLTKGAIWQIERARQATILLQQGSSILDTVHETGFADQPHLIRTLRHFMGLTPGQIIRRSEPQEMSFLFKTIPFR